MPAILVATIVFNALLSMARAEALPDPDLSPLIATIGLPESTAGADLLPRGQLRWRSTVATASHSTQQTAGNEALLFDGETTRLALAADYGLTDRLQLGMELPYLWHESGGLDHFVENWHDWFGLPNGIRDLVPQDQFGFLYQAGDATLLDLTRNQRGWGDLRITAGWQLRDDAQARTALRAMLKLPTGDSSKLTGSGSADLSLGIAGDFDGTAANSRWSSFYRAHVVVVGKPDRLSGPAKPVIGVLAGGITARVNPRLELTVQGKMRSAAYDSALRVLGDPALLLSLGGTVMLSDRLRLGVAVGEDVYVESVPDVSIALTLHFMPTAR